MKLVPVLVLALAAGLAPAPVCLAAAEPQPATDPAYPLLLDRVAPAIVTVHFILKSEGGPMGGDEEMEAMGTMIEPDGLVLVSNTELGGRGTPTDVKVLVGDDTEGVKARLVSRDSELDLAWIKIEKAPEKPYAAVSLADAATPGVGEPLYAVLRCGRFLEHAPMVIESRVAGVAHKPRHLYLGGKAFFPQFGAMGAPVFTAQGKLVGMVTLTVPEPDEMQNLTEGMLGMTRNMTAGTVLPAEQLASATKRAKEAAPKPDEAKPDEPKKDEPKPATAPAEKPAGH